MGTNCAIEHESLRRLMLKDIKTGQARVLLP